jgi:hypothetical protein
MWHDAASDNERLSWLEANAHDALFRTPSHARQLLIDSPGIEAQQACSAVVWRIVQATDRSDIAGRDVAVDAQVITRSSVE